ncbi:hypothetical protein KEM55_001683, partial [Ascosphaera atra]
MFSSSRLLCASLRRKSGALRLRSARVGPTLNRVGPCRYNTTDASASSSSSPAPSPSSSSPSARSSNTFRHLRNIIYVFAFTAAGYTAGNWIVSNYLGGVHEPGSLPDATRLAEIHHEFEGLADVQRLRRGAEAGKLEEWEPYTSFSETQKRGRLTSGGLNGSRGIAMQRIFWSPEEKRAITYCYLGNGITGWPGVIHGGLQATLLDESLGRVALRSFPNHAGVTANLNLDYKRPVAQNAFYKVVAELDTSR